MSLAEQVAIEVARALIDAAVAHVGKDKARELLDASSPAVIGANLAADVAEAVKFGGKP